MMRALYAWLDHHVFELGREIRLSYLPPLMVYMAYGISGLTGVVGTFFVKEYLGLSASFLASLGFWAGIPSATPSICCGGGKVGWSGWVRPCLPSVSALWPL